MLLLVSGQQLLGQNGGTAAAADTTPLFRSGVSNIRVDVQVLDRDGNILTGLAKTDFQLQENGKQQEILYAGRDAEQLNLLLLLDVSGSTKRYIEQMANVARDALRFLKPADKVAIMLFSKGQSVTLDFTDDRNEVARRLRDAGGDDKLGAGTEINSALLAAARYFDDKDPQGRRSILMLTDNLALHYQNPDEPVIDALERANVVVNAMVVGRGQKAEQNVKGRYANPDFTPADVWKISAATSGEAVKAERTGAAFARMVERIRSRYSLHYRMPEGPAGFRRINVEVTPDVRLKNPEVKVYARRGYYPK